MVNLVGHLNLKLESETTARKIPHIKHKAKVTSKRSNMTQPQAPGRTNKNLLTHPRPTWQSLQTQTGTILKHANSKIASGHTSYSLSLGNVGQQLQQTQRLKVLI